MVTMVFFNICKFEFFARFVGFIFCLLDISTSAKEIEEAKNIGYHTFQGEVLPVYEGKYCRRECEYPPSPRVCVYEFTAEWWFTLAKECDKCPQEREDCFKEGCVTADGKGRIAQFINKQLPGPYIQVCHDDVIRVKLINNLQSGHGTTIHWHGIHQRGTPYMDGVPLMTQCFVEYRNSFTYQFKADPPGTHFWHSHGAMQQGDGLFGPLVVRESKEKDASSHLYDEDLEEHIVFLQEWRSDTEFKMYLMLTVAQNFIPPASLLINGRLYDEELGIPEPRFFVEKGKSYRFRLIHAGNADCRLYFAIDDHKLLVIASDYGAIQPMEVDLINSGAGERFDFVIKADKDVANYWVKVRGASLCENYVTTGILTYEGANPTSAPTGGIKSEEILEKLQEKKDVETIVDTWLAYTEDIDPSILDLLYLQIPLAQKGSYANVTLEDIELYQELLKEMQDIKRPDMLNYLSYTEVDYNPILISEMRSITDNQDPALKEKPDYTYFFYTAVIDTDYIFVGNPTRTPLNDIYYVSTDAPPLTQPHIMNQVNYCDPDTLRKQGKNCSHEACACTYKYQIPTNSVVEAIFVGYASHALAGNHPYHLHGNGFRIVGSGVKDISSGYSIQLFKDEDAAGLIERNLVNPPFKDTFTTPSVGYVIIRMYTDNPGYWFLHCHLDVHIEWGMAVALSIGDPSEWDQPPREFDKCGSWPPPK